MTDTDKTDITKTQTHFPILFRCWSSVFDFYLWTPFLPSFLPCSPQSSTSYTSDFLSLFHSALFCSWMNEWMNEMGSLAFLPTLGQLHFFVGFPFVFFCRGVLGLVWGFLGFFLLCVCVLFGGFFRVRMEDSTAFFFVLLPFPTHFLSHLLFHPLFVFTWWCLGLPKCPLSLSGLFGPVFFKSSLLGPRYFSFFSIFF